MALPGVGGVVAQIAIAAFGAARQLAEAGHDPVVEVKRILAADPLLAEVRAAWQSEIEREFGKVPAPADTQPSGPPGVDPYEE
jgi:hypothetical protein